MFSNKYWKSKLNYDIIESFLKEGFICNKIDFSDLVQGEKFIALSDNEHIFYSHTHNVNDFFKLAATENKNFILISHNSDACVTDKPRDINFVKAIEHANFILKPSKCKFWFAQNVELYNPNLLPIPIGFPNNSYYLENFNLLEVNKRKKREIRNLVYLNSNIKNNFNVRSRLYYLFKNKKHVTVIKGQHGLNFQNFITDLRSHLFVVCPEGNGIDTHLVWEAISQDCIPIVMVSNNNYFLRDKLPILWVHDFEEINDIAYLFKEYVRIINSKYDLKEFHFSFWRELILDKSKSLIQN